MNKKTSTDFCSQEPNFPEHGFMTFLFIMHQENTLGVYPLITLFTSMSEVGPTIEEILDKANPEDGAVISESAIVVPVTFLSRYPLRREFWTNPSHHFDDDNRIKEFMPILTKYQFYQLLVTPASYKKEAWIFHATIPFLISMPGSFVENFMLLSDWPVDQSAKSAGIYAFGQPQRYNWKTQEICRFDEETNKKMDSLN